MQLTNRCYQFYKLVRVGLEKKAVFEVAMNFLTQLGFENIAKSDQN